MSNEQWQASRLKYWLDNVFNAVLVFCICTLLAILAGIDLEVLL